MQHNIALDSQTTDFNIIFSLMYVIAYIYIYILFFFRFIIYDIFNIFVVSKKIILIIYEF